MTPTLTDKIAAMAEKCALECGLTFGTDQFNAVVTGYELCAEDLLTLLKEQGAEFSEQDVIDAFVNSHEYIDGARFQYDKDAAVIGALKAEIRLCNADIVKGAKENKRLTRIIAKELSENDELGAEYTYVLALKEENKALRKVIGSCRDYINGRPDLSHIAYSKQQLEFIEKLSALERGES